MLINVTKVKSTAQSREELSLADEVDAARCGYAELRFAGPVSFSGAIENAAPYLELHGTARAAVRLECARCLWPFELELEAGIAEAYTNKAEALSADDSAEIGFFEGDCIDIAPALCAALFMELPMRPLCRADCRGICPQCGAELNEGGCACGQSNIDIRLSGLQSLLEAMQNSDNEKEVQRNGGSEE